MKARPRNPISVPRVNTSEWIFSRWIRYPWAAPNARPRRVATTTATTRPMSSTTETATIPATAATEPTERSSSPAMMVNPTASAASPSQAKPSKIVKILLAAAKRRSEMAKTTNTPRTTPGGPT